jgi:hypothetical protein
MVSMAENLSQESLHQLASRWSPSQNTVHQFKTYRDTSDFFRIEYGDIVVLNETPYLVRHNAKEGRFGLDDEVKFWVKRAIDLTSGETKIIKLVFYEKFIARIADIEFECFRSPRKEARILDLIGNHANFMHGFSVRDDQGNVVRILDFIYGRTIADHVRELTSRMDHETYFYQFFPEILDNYIACVEAIRFLHERGEKHGDIRRDHILLDRETGQWRWIDFDYNFRQRGESFYGFDLFGLGNVFIFLVGMGDVLIQDIKKANHPAFGALNDDDTNIVFNNRIANLIKIYPYIPENLNRILMHFSKSANVYYDQTSQLLEDLNEIKSDFTHREIRNEP